MDIQSAIKLLKSQGYKVFKPNPKPKPTPTRPPVEKVCEHCGNEFSVPAAYARQKRFCNDLCQKKANSAYQKARKQAMTAEIARVRADIIARQRMLAGKGTE